jgi:hypothetical protein
MEYEVLLLFTWTIYLFQKNAFFLWFCLFLRLKSVFEKKLIFYFIFLLQINMFLDYFDALISKIIFKNKKYIILIYF